MALEPTAEELAQAIHCIELVGIPLARRLTKSNSVSRRHRKALIIALRTFKEAPRKLKDPENP